tara:strand:+ start:596 stop:778 length:183 start_codon:yes stop_codon:yes gene_type:complete
MYRVIEQDYELVIWPEGQVEKDINDMVLQGKSKSEIQNIITQNTYSGLSALTQLNLFKRC